MIEGVRATLGGGPRSAAHEQSAARRDSAELGGPTPPAEVPEGECLLRISGLTKRFGRHEVLHGIDLTVNAGEFIGLMGPNGAGKSTLIKILAGVYTASSGSIELAGQNVRDLGGRSDVAFIHQDLGLIEGMSVVDNLRLGERPIRRFGLLLNREAEAADAQRALALIGLEVPVQTPVGALAPGEKTMVAVARAFARGARLVIVDEATSTLPPSDTARVISALSTAARNGKTVIMVTHKLVEILDATDRVVVLLDGLFAADAPTRGLDRAALVRMLLQKETGDRSQSTGTAGEPLIRFRGARGGKVGPIDLSVHAGEIVGVTGLPGSGMHDLALLACGDLRLTGGHIEHARADLRVGLLPPHRETQGGFAEMSVRENMAVSALARWRRWTRLLQSGQERRDTGDMAKRLNVQPGHVDGNFGALSGGNKQKVLFGRLLLAENDLYVLCEPTRGVDVGTRSELYELITGLRDQGAAVLIVTSDVEDLFGVCDRIGVVVDGHLGAVMPAGDVPADKLELMV